MSLVKLACPACGCLCDDIDVELEGNRIKRIENACAKGASIFYSGENPDRRNSCQIDGQEVPLEKAIEEAAYLLKRSSRRLIFGLDNSTLEAQAIGIELAQTLGSVLDDSSSFCQGALIEKILDGTIPSCSLPEVKDNADLLIYWGSNPSHTHPRHLSKFSYYSYTEYNELGWLPKVKLGCVEVRETEVSSLSNPFFKLKPGEDKDFIEAILTAARRSGSNPGEEADEAKAFTELVKSSHFCVIFVGLGLTYALDGDFRLFAEMVQEFNPSTRIAVIPMVGHYNMRGFNQSLYQRIGYVNKVSFAGAISYGDEYSFLEQVRNHLADCVLIVGSNPFSNLPYSIMKELQGVPVICLDPFATTTTKAAHVVIGTAISGLECDGRALRMDGEEIKLTQARVSNYPSDEEVLGRLLDRLSR